MKPEHGQVSQRNWMINANDPWQLPSDALCALKPQMLQKGLVPYETERCTKAQPPGSASGGLVVQSSQYISE